MSSLVRTSGRLAIGLAVLTALAACGEKPQTSGTRKADVSAANGAAAAYTAPGWKPGDAKSWEQQLKKRAEGQNEYARTAAGDGASASTPR